MYRPRNPQFMGMRFPMHPAAQQPQSTWPSTASAMPAPPSYPGYMNPHAAAMSGHLGSMASYAALSEAQTASHQSYLAGSAFTYNQMSQTMAATAAMAAASGPTVMPHEYANMHSASGQYAGRSSKSHIMPGQMSKQKARAMENSPYHIPRSSAQVPSSMQSQYHQYAAKHPTMPASTSHSHLQRPSFIPAETFHHAQTSASEAFKGYATSESMQTWPHSSQSYDHSVRTSMARAGPVGSYSEGYRSDFSSSPASTESPYAKVKKKTPNGQMTQAKSSVIMHTQHSGPTAAEAKVPNHVPSHPHQLRVPSSAAAIKQSQAKNHPVQRSPVPKPSATHISSQCTVSSTPPGTSDPPAPSLRSLPKLIPLEEANGKEEEAQTVESPLDLSKSAKRKASNGDAPLDLSVKKAKADDDLILVSVESKPPKNPMRQLGYGIYKRVQHLPPPPPLHRKTSQHAAQSYQQNGYQKSPALIAHNLSKSQTQDSHSYQQQNREQPSSDHTIMTALYNNTPQLRACQPLSHNHHASSSSSTQLPRKQPEGRGTNGQNHSTQAYGSIVEYQDKTHHVDNKLCHHYHHQDTSRTQVAKQHHNQLSENGTQSDQHRSTSSDAVPGIDLSKLDPNVIEQLERASSPRTRRILNQKFQKSQDFRPSPDLCNKPLVATGDATKECEASKNSFGVDIQPAKESNSPLLVPGARESGDKDTVVKPVTSEFTAWQVNRFKRVPVANVNPIMQDTETVESSSEHAVDKAEADISQTSAASNAQGTADGKQDAPAIESSSTEGMNAVVRTSAMSSISLHLVTPKGRFKLNNTTPLSKGAGSSATEPEASQQTDAKPAEKKKRKKESKAKKRKVSTSSESDKSVAGATQKRDRLKEKKKRLHQNNMAKMHKYKWRLRKKGFCGMGYNRDAAYEAELQRDIQRKILRSSKRQMKRKKSATEDSAKCYDGTTEEEDNGGATSSATTPKDAAKETSLSSPASTSRSASVQRKPASRGRPRSKKAAKTSTGSGKRSTFALCHGTVDETSVYNQDEADEFALCPSPPPPEVKTLIVCREIGETKLHKAARLGYEEVANWLVTSRVMDINTKDHAGYTALHEACANGHVSIVRTLLQHGADTNAASSDGTRPLHDAVMNNHIEVVRLLLSYEADPLITTYSGKTPLKLAKSTQMVALLKGVLNDLNGPATEEVSLGNSYCVPSPLAHDRDAALPMTTPALLPFTMYSVEPLRVYHLKLDNKKGPTNFYLLTDVVRQLEVSTETFKDEHKDITVYGINRTELETIESGSLDHSELSPGDIDEYAFIKATEKVDGLLYEDSVEQYAVNLLDMSVEESRKKEVKMKPMGKLSPCSVAVVDICANKGIYSHSGKMSGSLKMQPGSSAKMDTATCGDTEVDTVAHRDTKEMDTVQCGSSDAIADTREYGDSGGDTQFHSDIKAHMIKQEFKPVIEAVQSLAGYEGNRTEIKVEQRETIHAIPLIKQEPRDTWDEDEDCKNVIQDASTSPTENPKATLSNSSSENTKYAADDSAMKAMREVVSDNREVVSDNREVVSDNREIVGDNKDNCTETQSKCEDKMDNIEHQVPEASTSNENKNHTVEPMKQAGVIEATVSDNRGYSSEVKKLNEIDLKSTVEKHVGEQANQETSNDYSAMESTGISAENCTKERAVENVVSDSKNTCSQSNPESNAKCHIDSATSHNTIDNVRNTDSPQSFPETIPQTSNKISETTCHGVKSDATTPEAKATKTIVPKSAPRPGFHSLPVSCLPQRSTTSLQAVQKPQHHHHKFSACPNEKLPSYVATAGISAKLGISDRETLSIQESVSPRSVSGTSQNGLPRERMNQSEASTEGDLLLANKNSDISQHTRNPSCNSPSSLETLSTPHRCSPLVSAPEGQVQSVSPQSISTNAHSDDPARSPVLQDSDVAHDLSKKATDANLGSRNPCVPLPTGVESTSDTDLPSPSCAIPASQNISPARPGSLATGYDSTADTNSTCFPSPSCCIPASQIISPARPGSSATGFDSTVDTNSTCFPSPSCCIPASQNISPARPGSSATGYDSTVDMNSTCLPSPSCSNPASGDVSTAMPLPTCSRQSETVMKKTGCDNASFSQMSQATDTTDHLKSARSSVSPNGPNRLVSCLPPTTEDYSNAFMQFVEKQQSEERSYRVCK